MSARESLPAPPTSTTTPALASLVPRARPPVLEPSLVLVIVDIFSMVMVLVLHVSLVPWGQPPVRELLLALVVHNVRRLAMVKP